MLGVVEVGEVPDRRTVHLERLELLWSFKSCETSIWTVQDINFEVLCSHSLKCLLRLFARITLRLSHLFAQLCTVSSLVMCICIVYCVRMPTAGNSSIYPTQTPIAIVHGSSEWKFDLFLPRYSSLVYQSSSPFFPCSSGFPSSFFISAGFSSGNPRFLNSSLAIRFL